MPNLSVIKYWKNTWKAYVWETVYIPNKNNVIYNLQSGFRWQYSTSKNTSTPGNIDFGVFADLQKAFDTIDHQILLAQLNN